MIKKLTWQGRVVSVQPRVRLTRSYDQRSHGYLGYAVQVQGVIADEEGTFSIGLGKAAQAKHQLRVGDVVRGRSTSVSDPRTEPVEYYKTSGLTVLSRSDELAGAGPPWHGVPPALIVYRERGHRRLNAKTYAARCTSCQWGCRMPVEIIIDQWNPSKRRYRFETQCYGPKSCASYRAGPTRKVQGRKSYMVYEEEDWVDEESTQHRSIDE